LKKTPNIKAVRGWSNVLIIMSIMTWFICNAATYAYLTQPSLIDIIWGLTCWLPVPALGCAFAAWMLAYGKPRPKVARILAIIAAGLLVLPFVLLLILIL